MSAGSIPRFAASDGPAMDGGEEELLLIDAHVHIYDCFDLDRFLAAAAENFAAEAVRQGSAGRFRGVLLLTESAGDHWFTRLSRSAEHGSAERVSAAWTFAQTEEHASLIARGPGDRELVLVAGRQIVTAENLEVLALGTEMRFEDGAPLEAVVELVRDADSFPVIPWGFGKWLGNRGRILTDFLARSGDDDLMLGDNSGRPVFWAKPFHFSIAERRGIGILPGSDPLPFSRECDRAGRFGSAARAPFDAAMPAARIKQQLRDGLHTRPYGALETPLRFARNQIAMQLVKRLRRGDH